ncbi:hypothetical protein [Nocardioides sp.]|uniref:hypothetical protein n=1 Tax=Nocardioides sp. TaxID=35761 RepID=UPI002732D2D1|nr:hypothetical protein [Nocardioides sp.]MDP3891382.1 hypothetical protein [Nocardioides sp.]
MSRVVHLHIGAPKTGTTYLQDRLTLNAASLAEHGVHFPTKSRFVDADLFHFRAALDLLGQDWGGDPGHAQGAWDTMVRRVNRRSGTVIISHEILAPAKPDRIATAMNDLSGSEVHIVYSARDLARQLPAAWQESIKQGRKWSFRAFLRAVEKERAWFYRAFDLPEVLGSWGAHLPPDRVHVVTVPQSATADEDASLPGRGDTLWLRFCEVFGIDPAWAPLDSQRSNRSLGVTETQLLRKLNRRMDRETRREAQFDELIRGMLAQEELVRSRSPRVTMPPDRFDWIEAQTELWIDWLQGSGVHVVGSVDDLRPVRPEPDAEWVDPDRVRKRKVLRAAMDALEAMTREAAKRPDPERQLGQRVRSNVQRLRDR